MTRRRCIAFVAVGVSTLAAGCLTGGQPPLEGPTRSRMLSHFDLAIELRGHAVRGDLEGVRSAAETLADLDFTNDLPAALLDQLGPMRDAAGTAAAATDTQEAARGSAAIARSCGECHAANAVPLGDRFVVGGPPPGDGTLRHMAGLAWVSRLLWDGLIGPSDRMWIAGGEALGDAGILPESLTSDFSDREVGIASAWLQKMGRQAVVTDDAGERAELLAGIWTACADCHVQVLR